MFIKFSSFSVIAYKKLCSFGTSCRERLEYSIILIYLKSVLTVISLSSELPNFAFSSTLSNNVQQSIPLAF